MLSTQVSNKMAANEYVYVICQNARTGRVLTIVDNRESVEAEQLDGAAEGLLGKYLLKKT